MRMSMDAIALFALSDLSSLQNGEKETPLGPVELELLSDGIAVTLPLRFHVDPERIGSFLRGSLSDWVDAQESPRVYVYPNVARPEGSTFQARIDELGEGGMWVEVPPASAGIDANLMGQALEGLQSGGMLSAMQAMVQGGGVDMSALASIAQQVMQNPGLMQTVAEAAGQLETSGIAADPAAGGLLEQAQKIAGELASKNPNLMEEVGAMFEAQMGEEE